MIVKITNGGKTQEVLFDGLNFKPITPANPMLMNVLAGIVFDGDEPVGAIEHQIEERLDRDYGLWSELSGDPEEHGFTVKVSI